MRVLELFAGSATFSLVACELGHTAVTTDIHQFGNIDKVADILQLPMSDLGESFDLIWASPPCTSFSVASIGHHWNKDKTPKTEGALLGVRLVDRTLEIIDHYKPRYWYIENPRGMMRNLPQLRGSLRHTVTYCQYGETRMKPTDIWTNDVGWKPRPPCKNGDQCHVRAPRGAKTGTQGIKGKYERAVLPRELCLEILSDRKGES